MSKPSFRTAAPLAALSIVGAALGGCGQVPSSGIDASTRLTERECLARVMYFESNRSSEAGMLAVGTVVMNRVQSPRYPKTVCGVVGQPQQFAEGALSKPMNQGNVARAFKVADEVLDGKRHSGIGSAMFFHTAGYTYPYRNMHYLALAGGNAFYEKRQPTPDSPNVKIPSVLVAQAQRDPARTILVADATPLFRHKPIEQDDDEAAPAAEPMRSVIANRVPAPLPTVVAAASPRPVPSEKPRPIVVAEARTVPIERSATIQRPATGHRSDAVLLAAAEVLAKPSPAKVSSAKVSGAASGHKPTPSVLALNPVRPALGRTSSRPEPIVIAAVKGGAGSKTAGQKSKPVMVAMLLPPPRHERGREESRAR